MLLKKIDTLNLTQNVFCLPAWCPYAEPWAYAKGAAEMGIEKQNKNYMPDIYTSIYD